MTPAEEATAAEVRARALRDRYLAHDPAVTFAEWRREAGEARRLRAVADEAARRPVLIQGGAA